MLYGKVIKYFPEKKFGFIQADFGPDVFFHLSVVDDGESLRDIQRGQPVKYETMPVEKVKPEDRSVTGKDPSEQRKAKRVVLIEKYPGGTLDELAPRPKTVPHQRARKKKPTWRR